MAAKASPKKVSAKKSTTEYKGSKVIFNASEPAKNPARVAAARKARATIKARAAAKLKKKTSTKRGVKKAGKKGKKAAKKTGVKRGPSAFFLFSADNRAAVKKANPSFKVTEIASELGKRWRNLSADKRKAYDAKAAAGKKN